MKALVAAVAGLSSTGIVVLPTAVYAQSTSEGSTGFVAESGSDVVSQNTIELPVQSGTDLSADTTADQTIEEANQPAVEASTNSEPWRSTVELYGFAPLKTTGTVRVRGFEADLDLDLGDVLSALEFAAYVRGSVERGRWGLLTDLSYARLGAAGASTAPSGLRTGKAEVSSSLGIYDLAVRYRFGEPEAAIGEKGSYTIIPYVGVRVIDTNLDGTWRCRAWAHWA
ncbi:hypothetical protein KBY96_15935 [Cyanobium sp. ATX 6A2]|uniref:hypothetical protein n=1 Tax=Cyanobium sp. ATX 6A2 TaxID=2823700 RepID=UPI0020CE77D9|nr:hypothetical protein [Cyanobium sp. ATX 6A2]MCP9889406.1 hypothetical protein [Cyanobium sp. ATX 6A2]